MAGARLVFSIGGTTTELSVAVTSAKQMLGDLARTAAKPADPGRSSGLKAAIDEQRKQLALMKGSYDEVTAKAIEFRRKGAPQDLINQYVALRREILATAAAEKAAADQAAARAAQNAAYIASQERLAAARSSARSAAMNPSAGGKAGGGGMNGMLFPMAMNSLAVGFQDSVSVYQTNGSPLAAISAAGNNIIFLLTLLNPLAGALGAITIGLTQLGVAWLNSGDNAEEAAKKQEEAAERMTNSLKAAADIRNKLAEGDVQGVDKDVNTIGGDLRAREREVAYLDKQLDSEFAKPRAERNYEKIEAAEKRKDEAQGEIMDLRAQLADAKEVQSKITPWQRKVANFKGSAGEDAVNELDKLRNETAVLTGKETELQQKQRGWRAAGVAGNTINDLSAAFEANKAAKEADDAKKKAERENEAADAKAKREAEQAATKRKAEGDRVREETRSPWETWRDEGKRLRGLWEDGEIDADTYSRGVKKATKDRNSALMKDIPDRVSHAQTLVRGSVEAARVATTGRRDEKLETIAHQQLNETKAMRQAMERQSRNPLQRPKLKEGK